MEQSAARVIYVSCAPTNTNESVETSRSQSWMMVVVQHILPTIPTRKMRQWRRRQGLKIKEPSIHWSESGMRIPFSLVLSAEQQQKSTEKNPKLTDITCTLWLLLPGVHWRPSIYFTLRRISIPAAAPKRIKQNIIEWQLLHFESVSATPTHTSPCIVNKNNCVHRETVKSSEHWQKKLNGLHCEWCAQHDQVTPQKEVNDVHSQHLSVSAYQSTDERMRESN